LTSMSILILALTAGMCCWDHLTVWLCWLILARETSAVMPAYGVGCQKKKRTSTTAILNLKPRNQHRLIFCSQCVYDQLAEIWTQNFLNHQNEKFGKSSFVL
jgi:hypothetical protein